jgi:hypothetical protein
VFFECDMFHRVRVFTMFQIPFARNADKGEKAVSGVFNLLLRNPWMGNLLKWRCGGDRDLCSWQMELKTYLRHESLLKFKISLRKRGQKQKSLASPSFSNP